MTNDAWKAPEVKIYRKSIQGLTKHSSSYGKSGEIV